MYNLFFIGVFQRNFVHKIDKMARLKREELSRLQDIAKHLFISDNSITQKEIAEKYRKIEQIKKSISAELDKIANIEIDYE